MNLFDILAEFKFREWFKRPPAERAAVEKADAGFARTESFERQLLDQIRGLYAEAASAPPPVAEQKRAKALEIEMQLMILLETQGLNLMARRVADEIADMKRVGERPPDR